jgi:S1-C subfamily serine protease
MAGIRNSTLALAVIVVLLAGCAGHSAKLAETTSTRAAKPPSFSDLIARVKTGIIRIEADGCDGTAIGTGFLISPRLVATVEHVVDGATLVSLKRNGRKVGTGTVIGADATRDLALVRTSRPLGGYEFKLERRAPRLGEDVAAIGFPLGLPLTVTRGSVSGLRRAIPIEGITRRRLVQTDAAVNPGNSGGPLMSADTGEVVGLVDLGTTEANGISFAVSAQVAKPLLDAWTLSPQEVAMPSCSFSPPPVEAAPAEPPSGGGTSAETFTGSYFTVDYPSSWSVETAEASKGGYLDTTIRSTEQSFVMLRVDVTPGLGGDPMSDAQPVISALRRSPGYRELALRRTTYDGYDAVLWEFTIPESGTTLHKVDVFFVDSAGDEFAVLTQAPSSSYGSWASTFASVRDSLYTNDD